VGSMGSLFFTREPVVDFATAKKSNQNLFVRYYKRMLDQGIYLAPSAFEASFLSTAHTDEAIQKTLECAKKAFGDLSG